MSKSRPTAAPRKEGKLPPNASRAEVSEMQADAHETIKRRASGTPMRTDTEDVCPIVLTRAGIERASRRPIDDRLISITAKCHPDAGVKVWYQASTGRALLACASCAAPSVWIQVANGVPT